MDRAINWIKHINRIGKLRTGRDHYLCVSVTDGLNAAHIPCNHTLAFRTSHEERPNG